MTAAGATARLAPAPMLRGAASVLELSSGESGGATSSYWQLVASRCRSQPSPLRLHVGGSPVDQHLGSAVDEVGFDVGQPRDDLGAVGDLLLTC